MDLEEFKSKLRKYKKEDIIISEHAGLRAFVRNLDIEEVKNNIIISEKLVYFKEHKAKKDYEKKYECYFAYSKFYCHKYILSINSKVIIVTIISINRDWQKLLK